MWRNQQANGNLSGAAVRIFQEVLVNNMALDVLPSCVGRLSGAILLTLRLNRQ